MRGELMKPSQSNRKMQPRQLGNNRTALAASDAVLMRFGMRIGIVSPLMTADGLGHTINERTEANILTA